MPATPTLIIIVVAIIIAMILLMRWMQPKFSPGEKYLLHVIQRKSAQMDNIRLFMWIKMILHPVMQISDLEYQDEYLEDVEKYKQLTEQFYGFGPSALYTLLGYESLMWHLSTTAPDPLIVRLAANQVCRRYPHTAAIIEDLLIAAPDEVTAKYLKKNSMGLSDPKSLAPRYQYLLKEILQTIASTPRNDWWPGSSPDVREWAESLLTKIVAKEQALTRTE
jgi:hypothetical protein